ncbi:hypothetical protein tinsulaeT_34420 [Thalassotalea insulae]|uniref:DUF2066 domain-containing protein n=1 Tax=Thalassotalea insulae TaxID=2056778 RepID=A0ABQ6GZW1_9GAMM|nr:DUF2066 domain-containing protein [Thalassotalea insulae]GLX80102.1 hypothetical protein tinsulaeT_34420 [Thalassotalea insulae]
MKKLSLTGMMRYWLVFTVNLLVLLTQSVVNAVEVKDLYVAKVAVNSQSSNDRNLALKQALRSVLVKVGGQQQVLSDDELKKQLNRYNSLVTNYRYERANGQQYLRASFDPAKINDLFVEASLPIWGSLRPQIVLWLINEQGLKRNLVVPEKNDELTQAVTEFIELRGLPVVLPNAELAGGSLSISDIWGRFQQPLISASQQYLAEAILVVRVSDNTLLSQEQLTIAEQCQLLCQPAIALDWSFISTANNDETQQFSERYYGTERSELLSQALNDIADDLYQRYALTTGDNNQFELEVANIDSLAHYVQVKDFLQQLSAVQSVKLVSAVGMTRRFNLTLLGSKQALLASLKLNSTLKQYIDPLAPEIPGSVPVFYWEQHE